MIVSVNIDSQDVLDEMNTQDLRKELAKRSVEDIGEIPDKHEVNQTLDDVAFHLRKTGRVNLAYRVDEIRHDYFK